MVILVFAVDDVDDTIGTIWTDCKDSQTNVTINSDTGNRNNMVDSNANNMCTICMEILSPFQIQTANYRIYVKKDCVSLIYNAMPTNPTKVRTFIHCKEL